MIRNFPDYSEEVLNNLLAMSDYHLYISIPTLNSWRASGHPQAFDGKKVVQFRDLSIEKMIHNHRIQNLYKTSECWPGCFLQKAQWEKCSSQIQRCSSNSKGDQGAAVYRAASASGQWEGAGQEWCQLQSWWRGLLLRKISISDEDHQIKYMIIA